MGKVFIEESSLTAIGDAIRAKTGGGSGLVVPDGMVDGVGDVYRAGKLAERDAFWCEFQNNGGEVNYYYAFAYDKFTDETYNPQHDIVCQSNVATSSQYMFYNAAGITDTKVPICLNGEQASYTFANCTNIVRIPKIVVHEALTYKSTFYNCYALEHLKIEGTIGTFIALTWSTKLNKESITSVVSALSNTATGQALTLSSKAVGNAFGENLLDLSAKTETSGGVTFTYDGEGNIIANGTIPAGTPVTLILNSSSACKADGEIWLLSVDGWTGGSLFCQISDDLPFNLTVGEVLKIPMKEGDTARIVMPAYTDTTLDNVKITPRIIRLTDEWTELVDSKPNWDIAIV